MTFVHLPDRSGECTSACRSIRGARAFVFTNYRSPLNDHHVNGGHRRSRSARDQRGATAYHCGARRHSEPGEDVTEVSAHGSFIDAQTIGSERLCSSSRAPTVAIWSSHREQMVAASGMAVG